MKILPGWIGLMALVTGFLLTTPYLSRVVAQDQETSAPESPAPVDEGIDPHADWILRQMGEYLAQLHAITCDSYGYVGAHRPMEPQPTWWQAFRIMWGKLVDDTVGVGMYSDDEREELVELLDRYSAVFDRPVASSLLHMDVWAQNILVDDECHVTGIVDWDRALWGDPEIEYAVLDYCGISRPGFWEGYGRARDDTREARTRQIFYFLYEHQKYILIRAARRNNPDAARRYKAEVFRVIRDNFGL